MRFRKIHLLTLLTLMAVGASWLGWTQWQRHRIRNVATRAVPLRPDLSRWSNEFVACIDAAEADIRSGKDVSGGLTRLTLLYLGNGLTAQAEPVLQALQRLEPMEARWTYYLADLARLANQTAAEQHWLRETNRLAPNYAPAAYYLGEVLRAGHDPAEARQFLQRAAQLAPHDARAHAALGEMALELNQVEEALRHGQRALQAHPRYARAHALVAAACSRRGDTANATRHQQAERAGERYFTLPDPWMDELGNYCHDPSRLGLMAARYYRANQWEAALPFIQRGVELTPHEGEFYDLLAEAYEQLGRTAEALAVLEEARQRAPDDYTVTIRLAVHHLRHRRVEAAETAAREAITLWPSVPEVHATLGSVHQAAGRHAAAVDAFRAALAQRQNTASVHFSLAMSLVALDRVPEARAALEETVALQPEHAKAWKELTRLALATEDWDTADRTSTRLLNLQPDDADSRRISAGVQLVRARSLAEAGDLANAERTYRRGIGIDPTLGLLHAGLGMVYRQTGRPAEALAALRRYVEAAPDDLNAYLMLGLSLKEAGQTQEARDLFQRGDALARASGQDHSAFERLLAAP
jgi:tetratricopeptide (TPR) repeat protein